MSKKQTEPLTGDAAWREAKRAIAERNEAAWARGRAVRAASNEALMDKQRAAERREFDRLPSQPTRP